MLDVARREFALHGYVGATMRTIAAAADMTPMALYKYAPSKAVLFVSAWEDSIDQVYADYEDVVAGRGSLLEEVEALLDRSRELLVERPEHIRLVLRVLLDHDAECNKQDCGYRQMKCRPGRREASPVRELTGRLLRSG